MAAISTMVAAAGVGIAAAGAVTNFAAAKQQKAANAQSIAAQQQAEAIRQKAMEVDANRRRRQLVREGIIARSQALATTTSAGANQSSGLFGAIGQISGRTAWGVSGINASESTGSQLFAANQDLLRAKLSMGNAQSLGQVGSGLTSLGGAMVNSYGAMDRIFGSTGASNTGFKYQGGGTYFSPSQGFGGVY